VKKNCEIYPLFLGEVSGERSRGRRGGDWIGHWENLWETTKLKLKLEFWQKP